jgi:hypothetical protein
MNLGESVIWALVVLSPAVVCLAIGATLLLGRAFQHRTSPWGLRLVALFPCLLFGIPGLAAVAGVATGSQQWPAALWGVLNIGIGLRFVIWLGRRWRVLGRGSNE